ncbi:MAG: hypothetical protein JOY94_16430 [Methylobacteriaceae bacterium]|nr:hypothetical protein [Methylobacteriaceae bacterium]
MSPSIAELSGPPSVALRAPETVMRLARMGSFHPTRLSFLRVLLRRLRRDNWQFDRPVWRVDRRGEGVAVYRVCGKGRTYSLVAFPHHLDPAKRTDRVIAEEWDATFVLHDGEVSEADIARLAANVPYQEAGRCSAEEIVLSRANKSVRLFDYVVGRLAAGEQPDSAELDAVGYLMRTTAVYANGKFGLADRERIAGRIEFAGPFAAEMLSIWLIRAFTVDWADHLAAARAPDSAVRLDTGLRRRLGVGNATGLGMAPFLINHPSLLDSWMGARETALARVRAIRRAGSDRVARFVELVAQAQAQASRWRTGDEVQSRRIAGLAADLAALRADLRDFPFDRSYPWDALFDWSAAHLGEEAQELLLALLLEPHGDLVDDLAACMVSDEEREFVIDGGMTIGALAALLRQHYAFAFEIDFTKPTAQALFWYVSEEKLEPRLGRRDEEPGAEWEQPLTVARDVVALAKALELHHETYSVASFLAGAPEFRQIVRRVQIAARRPYAEIRDNLIDAVVRPIDLLRCKLSFFGATRFDPKSDRWVRITLFENAPFPDELHARPDDNWSFGPPGAQAT